MQKTMKKPINAGRRMFQKTLNGRILPILRSPMSRFARKNSGGFKAKLAHGEHVETIILSAVAFHLQMHVEHQSAGSRFDFKVGGSHDRAESKSTSSLRESMLIDADKLKTKPLGRLWLVFSNRRGVWIMEYKRGDFERSFGPARPEAGWTRLVFEVPVKYMTPIALFGK